MIRVIKHIQRKFLQLILHDKMSVYPVYFVLSNNENLFYPSIYHDNIYKLMWNNIKWM